MTSRQDPMTNVLKTSHIVMTSARVMSLRPLQTALLIARQHVFRAARGVTIPEHGTKKNRMLDALVITA